jgi:hypothetical protein
MAPSDGFSHLDGSEHTDVQSVAIIAIKDLL